jgi:hypothetical protein
LPRVLAFFYKCCFRGHVIVGFLQEVFALFCPRCLLPLELRNLYLILNTLFSPCRLLLLEGFVFGGVLDLQTRGQNTVSQSLRH